MDSQVRRGMPQETDTRPNRALRKKGKKEVEMRVRVEEVMTRDVKSCAPDTDLAGELLDKHLGIGLAVAGVRDTLIALTLGQVDDMFISASEQDVRDNLIGKDAELIPGLPEDVEGNGRARGAVIADELVARARLTHADVTFIEDAARLADYGGIIAKLRFRI
jgi:hypothetical protein